MPRLYRSPLVAVAVAVTACVLVACGSSGGSGSSDGPKDAAKVLSETFSGAKSVKSGQLGLTLKLQGKGAGAGTPSTIALTGPFQSNGVRKVPSFDLTLALSGQGQTFTVGATSTGTKGYVTVAGTSYVLDGKTFDQFAKGYTTTQSGSTTDQDATTLAKLGIDPQRWLTAPKVVGTTATGGTDTIHVVAGIAVPSLLADLNRLLGRASGTAVPSTGATVPDKLTARQLAEAEKAISGVKVDVFTGKGDRALRRMVVAFDLALENGQTLYGFGGGRVTLDFTISDLNAPQSITAPKDAQPFSALQKQLGDVTAELQDPSAAAKGSSGSGSEGSADAATASSKYLQCLQQAGDDLAAVQKCASLVGQ